MKLSICDRDGSCTEMDIVDIPYHHAPKTMLWRDMRPESITTDDYVAVRPVIVPEEAPNLSIDAAKDT